MSRGARGRVLEERKATGNNRDGSLVWKDGRAPAVLCSARRKNGTPCKRPPVAGTNVCRAHGGAAPQVKRKAQERLLEGVPKMLRTLHSLATDETIPPAVRLAAVRDWLDRAGIDRKIEVEITSSSFDQLLAGVVASVGEDHEVANRQDYLDRSGFDVVEGEVVAPSHERDTGGDDISPPQGLARR